jgi:hypothetical protein
LDFTTLEQVYNSKDAQGKLSLKKAFDDKQNALQQEETGLNDQLKTQLPRYQQQRDNAVINQALGERSLNEFLAANGQYGGGRGYSRLAQLAVQRNGAIAGANTGENQLRNTFNTRINQLHGDLTRNQQSYADETSTFEKQIMAELSQAKQQKLDEEQKYRQQLSTSRTRTNTPKAPSATEIQRMGAAGAYQGVEDAFGSGASLDEVINEIYSQASDLASMGLKPDDIAQYARTRYQNWNGGGSQSLSYRDASMSGNRGMGGFVPQ